MTHEKLYFIAGGNAIAFYAGIQPGPENYRASER
jgi:hypothetical protein